MKPHLTLMAAMFAAASLACSFTVDVPRLQTGPTETVTVDEAAPDGASVTEVLLRMGAGTFRLSGGAAGLAEGTVRYNVPEWKPAVVRDGNRLTIEQRRRDGIRGVPEADVVNDWDLRLGDAPMDLSVEAGAYRGTLDLGGLRLQRLSISDGASESNVRFDSANPEIMETLSYETGASKVTLTGLGNANFETMNFQGGIGDYTLDFSGELQRDARVSVTSGVSHVRIVVPSGTAARVTVTGGLNNVTPVGAWSVSGGAYSLEGTGPALSIDVEMGVGDLTLVEE